MAKKFTAAYRRLRETYVTLADEENNFDDIMKVNCTKMEASGAKNVAEKKKSLAGPTEKKKKRSTNQQCPSHPGCFVVELDKGGASDAIGFVKPPLGLVLGRYVELSHTQTLKVKEIKEGHAQNYNRSVGKSAQIKPGDCILDVNGISGDSGKMLKEIKSAEQLRLVVKPSKLQDSHEKAI